MATVDGPLSGSADTTYYFYTSNRRLLGTIGPDPDGTGPRKRQAMHHTYIGVKPIQKTEYGTANGGTEADLLAMTPIQAVSYSYDTHGNKTKETHSGTSGAVSVENGRAHVRTTVNYGQNVCP